MGMVFAYYNGKFEFVGEEGNPVDMGLPESTVFVELPDFPERLGEKGIREHYKVKISETTSSYIKRKLQEIDEDLADLTSEAQVIEGRILYLAAKENVSITTDEVKQKIALFIAGQYTQDDAVKELKEKGLSDETIQKILPLLQRGVEIARILNWKEEIWAKEAELESQMDGMTLEQLLQLDVKALCEEAYKQIPLEV